MRDFKDLGPLIRKKCISFPLIVINFMKILFKLMPLCKLSFTIQKDPAHLDQLSLESPIKTETWTVYWIKSFLSVTGKIKPFQQHISKSIKQTGAFIIIRADDGEVNQS